MIQISSFDTLQVQEGLADKWIFKRKQSEARSSAKEIDKKIS